MGTVKEVWFKGILVFLVGLLIFPPTTSGITIKEEDELAKEFMKVVTQHYRLINDPVIVDYVDKVGHKIVSVLPQQPFDYRFYVVDESVYNAFAGPGGHIFIHRGLFEAMASEDELAGILGHEISHVANRHISDMIEESKKIGIATLAGIAAGIFLGVGGAAEAGNALTIGSMAAGQSMSLAYSRKNERQADELGLKYIVAAGYSVEGLLSALKKIRGKQWFGSEQVPTYLNTHPGTEERIVYIGSWLDQHKTARTEAPTKSSSTEAFQRVHTRLLGLYGGEQMALTHFQEILKNKPSDALANYGYALVLARTAKRAEAITHLKKALEQRPFAMDFLKELGRIYFQDGRYQDALHTFDSLMKISSYDPEVALYKSRAQMGLGQYAKAADTLEELLASSKKDVRIHYYLGETYGKEGRFDKAHYHLGIFYQEQSDSRNALFHYKKALSITKDPTEKKDIEARLKKVEKAARSFRSDGGKEQSFF